MMADPSSIVLNSVQSQLQSQPGVSPDCCIYTVPENLRKVNEDAYRPSVVSIGPVHYLNTCSETMRRQKLRYLKSFLGRGSVSLYSLVQCIREREMRARNCYFETIMLPSSEVFVEMLLIDAVFIIELFLRGCYNELIDLEDRIFNKPRMVIEVSRDIRLEENQLPFFILKDLCELANISSFISRPCTFLDLAYGFHTESRSAAPQSIANAEIKHLVDFLRVCHLPSVLRDLNTNQIFEFTSSVTRLSESGVKFVAVRSENLLDIRFNKGVLKIPKIIVTDDTETLFRNMMVFEQCHYYSDSYIIDYIAFLDSLINTPRDVEILTQRGIIENWLGNDEEVANLFSKLFKETRLQHKKFYYSGICRDLNAYAGTHWHRWRAILRQKYFNHPWAAISVIYAVVLLILTVLQVVTGFK